MVFKRKSKDNELYERNPGLVVPSRPKSVIAEQFRALRTNIEFSMIDHDLKSLVVTSTGPEAGKSIIAANLAAIFATEDKRVLLVDADLRKPTVHKTFRLRNTDGLTTLLMQQNTDLSDIVYKTNKKGLYVVTSGPVPPNPADLLGTKRMEILKEEMEEMFDLVIFDMPPILAVTDAQIMASKVDGTIFVLPESGVTKESALKAKELLEMAEANVIGAVVNRAEKTKDSYYYYAEEE